MNNIVYAPESVKENLREGLRLYSLGFGGKGLMPETVKWARHLADDGEITYEKAVKMRAWFARHGAKGTAETARRNRDPRSPAMVAWLLWGGDEAIDWSKEVCEYLAPL